MNETLPSDAAAHLHRMTVVPPQDDEVLRMAGDVLRNAAELPYMPSVELRIHDRLYTLEAAEDVLVIMYALELSRTEMMDALQAADAGRNEEAKRERAA